jgi:hypothetical protein
LFCHEPYVCGTNLLQHTHFGGDRYLSHQTKYLWQEANATIETFCGERTVSTKPNWWRLVVTMDKIFVARDYCDNTNILWRGLFQNRCDKADKHGCFDLMPH